MKFITSLAGLLVAFSLAACSSSSPEDVVKQYINGLDKGNVEAVLATFPPSKFAENPQLKDAMASVAARSVTAIAKKGGVKQVETTAVERGDVAEVKSVTTFGDGGIEKKTYDVLKLDGKWYIN